MFTKTVITSTAPDESDRPLRRAVLIMWLLALLHLAAAMTAMRFAVLPAVGSRPRQVALMAAFFGTPAAIHLLSAIYLRYRKFWAAILGLLGAIIELATIFALTIDWIGYFFILHKPVIGLLITAASLVLIVLAIYLILNLTRTMSILQRPPIGIRRGFEPLRVETVNRVEPHESTEGVRSAQARS